MYHYLNQKYHEEDLGLEKMPRKSVIIDYGGPNIAKPLHVGHLRSAIIGESIKRLYKFMGHDVIGDIHLGDWGLQIGLVIEELKETMPDLVYFEENFEGDYPTMPPFDIHGLSDLYPRASSRSKKDPLYLKAVRTNTSELQAGRKGYMALWQHILKVSMADLKKNYQTLNIYFDLWLGESHAMHDIETVVQLLTDKKMLRKDQGALIVDVSLDDDKGPMPPMILLKSDGAALYSTTDLTTIYQRTQEKHLDEIIYVVDKRQELHFEQVFRCSKMAEIVDNKLELNFIGFGTMNGLDGKPFKTRDGGVMKLEDLILILRDAAKDKIHTARDYGIDKVDEIAMKVGLAALKFGDLSNVSTKDYVFDLDRFLNFEGKTGPYIQYSLVRIKSILKKAGSYHFDLTQAVSATQHAIYQKLLQVDQVFYQAFYDKAPNKVCEFAFELSNLSNRFYHECRILVEGNDQRDNQLSLLKYIHDVLETCLYLLGIDSLEEM